PGRGPLRADRLHLRPRAVGGARSGAGALRHRALASCGNRYIHRTPERSSGNGRAAMTTESRESQTVRRTVQFKFTLPAASTDHLASLLRSAAPFYEAFGGRRIRLLQNVDDRSRFIHEIEYDTHEVIELNRQRVASDPRVQAYLQTWRSLMPGAVEIDVYEDVG